MTGIFLTLIGAKTVVPPQPVNVSTNVSGLGATAIVRSVTVSTPTVSGSQTFTTVGSTDFVVPYGVTSISVVCVGGGGGGGACGFNSTYPNGFSGACGGGGGLVWANNIPVTPGEVITVVVGGGGSGGSGLGVAAGSGGSSYINAIRDGSTKTILTATGGEGGRGVTSNGTPKTRPDGGAGSVNATYISGTYRINEGGTGTAGRISTGAIGGGGGAAGYTGSGGNGDTGSLGNPGSGGGGGSGYASDGSDVYSGGGGGVGISSGQGANGAGGTFGSFAGKGGSGGGNGGNGLAGLVLPNGANGGLYGGGAGSADDDISLNPGFIGGQGAVKIYWPGTTKTFPSSV